MNSWRIISRLLRAAMVITAMAGGAPAFCPMCRTAIEGATGAQELAGGLNLAALVLLVPPVMIFATLFGLFYRLRQASGRNAALGDADEKRPALTE